MSKSQRKPMLHAHFDCFSGAAGDMMLAACLDAADSLPAHALHLLPFSDGIQSSTNGSETKNSDVLLAQITRALEEGLPELKGEFQLTSKRVWRGLGQIAAKKVDVDSIYNHEAAPVPGAEKRQNREENVEDSQQNHSHEHSHEHKHEHQHQHSHDHKNERGEASGQNLAHSHSHNHFTNEGPGVENALKQEEGAKEDPLFLGHSHNHGHSHSHEHNHNHTHSHDHDHSHNHSLSHNHSHDHASYSKLRNLPEITKMLRNAPPSHIPKRVATLAIEAFTALAHAEKNTHGASSIDQVHFHEVGAVDSIVDTVGTLLGLYYLGVDLGSDEHDKNIVIDGRGKKCAITCSRLPLGEGTVWTDHGLLPVPAPATMHLLVGMPTCPGPAGVTGELVTPTAAALLRVVTGVHDRERGDVVCMGEGGGFWKPRELDGRPPCWTPRAVGLGAGSKNFERHPNILRLLLGDGLEQQKYHDIAVEVPLEAAKDGRENDAGKNMKKESDEVEQTEEGKNNAALQTRAAPKETPSCFDGGAKMQAGTNRSAPDEPNLELWDIHTLTHLEANIDDATPELLAHAIDLLMKYGAIDAWVYPIVMKKGRPAHSLNCICRADASMNRGCSPATSDREQSAEITAESKLLGVLFRHTTTLGIRIHRNILRAALQRRFVEVQLPFRDNLREGKVDVKISSFKSGEVVSVKAEFDQCKIVSEECGIPVKKVSNMAERLAWDELDNLY